MWYIQFTLLYPRIYTLSLMRLRCCLFQMSWIESLTGGHDVCINLRTIASFADRYTVVSDWGRLFHWLKVPLFASDWGWLFPWLMVPLFVSDWRLMFYLLMILLFYQVEDDCFIYWWPRCCIRLGIIMLIWMMVLSKVQYQHSWTGLAATPTVYHRQF